MTPDELAREIAASPRHAGIYPALLARICAEEHRKYKKDRDRIKAVKGRLHQIHGAYLADGSPPALAPLCREGDAAMAARAAMACHVSTRERLPCLDAFYAFLFDHLPATNTLADIGCGLNPLFLSAIPHPPIAQYYAYDIDTRPLALLSAYFDATGQPAETHPCDAVTETPTQPTDATLLLKLLPVLDAQKTGRGIALLQGLNTRAAVVSFPTASLSGKGKGQAAHYAKQYEAPMFEVRHLIAQRQIGNEIVYILGEPR